MSLSRNTGRLDRAIRLVAGLVLLVAAIALFAGVWQWAALVIGLVLVVTALVGFCPLYTLFGIDTREADARQADGRRTS